MNSKVETAGSTVLDSLKLLVAAGLVGGGIGGYYYWEEHSHLLRVIGILVACIMAVLIAVQTDKGRTAWAFFRESRNEVRKVVWPTRKETTQTTMLVVLMVLFMALFMWLLDMMLGWGVGVLTQPRG